MAKLLGDRYLWYIVAIMVLTSILLYTTETYVLNWLPSQENWHLTYLTLLNLMLLMAVAIAAWRFGVKGGLALCLAIGLILLPHSIFEIVGALRIDWVAELMLIGAVGITLSWLVGTRKRATEALRHAAEEWRTTFDSTLDLISIHDRDYKIVRVNKAYADAFNMKPGEIIGHTCYEVLERTKEPPPYCPHMKTLETKEPAVSEFFVPHLDIHLEATTSPIFNKKGEVIASVHVARDITERKRAEAEKHEIEQKAQLASHLASVGEMASGIAHEINNPLTSVIGFSQLLIQKDIPSDIKQEVKIINDGAQRVAGIVKRLLTFARQHELEREYIDINEVIKTTLALRAYELETGNIKVTAQLVPDLPRTMADGGQLQQVFLNIIINAETEMKLAHGGGSLLVKTETIGNTIGISFTDDGPGIARENLDKIFDPFFTTRDAGRGTGLGLSVCHGIIAEHNGRIYVESELGKGATFVVELPLVSRLEQPEVPEVAKPAIREAQRITGAKMLVVDDEPAIRQFLSRVLADEGHKVETVDNASDALERVKSREYNLVLLDIKMPGMSGPELYKRVREIAQPLAKRIVFITGDVMGVGTRDFLSETKASYIVKPFDAEELKKDIARILAESQKS